MVYFLAFQLHFSQKVSIVGKDHLHLQSAKGQYYIKEYKDIIWYMNTRKKTTLTLYQHHKVHSLVGSLTILFMKKRKGVLACLHLPNYRSTWITGNICGCSCAVRFLNVMLLDQSVGHALYIFQDIWFLAMCHTSIPLPTGALTLW